MSETNNKQEEIVVVGAEAEAAAAEIESTDNDLVNNGFYCEKCYDMINFFIGEIEKLSPKATKFKNSYLKSKNERIKIKYKYETLQFDYDEVKTQKEDIEERYNLFLKALAAKNSLTSNQLVVATAPSSNKSEQTIKKSTSTSTSTSTTKISFNMSLLNEKVFGQSLINRDYVYDYFGKILKNAIKESNRRCLPSNEIEVLKTEIESLKKQLVSKEEELNLNKIKSNETIHSLECN